MSAFEHIIVESQGAVGIIKLNRPKMLNALSFGVFKEIAVAIDELEADDTIGCILITGSEKAFAAGGCSRGSRGDHGRFSRGQRYGGGGSALL